MSTLRAARDKQCQWVLRRLYLCGPSYLHHVFAERAIVYVWQSGLGAGWALFTVSWIIALINLIVVLVSGKGDAKATSYSVHSPSAVSVQENDTAALAADKQSGAASPV